jgi:alcohol dehydrogenase
MTTFNLSPHLLLLKILQPPLTIQTNILTTIMLSPKALARLQYSIRPKALRSLAYKTFPSIRQASTMKALVYNGPGSFGLEDKPKPTLQGPKDAIVKLKYTTICGTDLHILQGDNLTSKPGTILGHEGVGIVEEIGAGISSFKKGDQVMISCISSCGICEYCRRSMYSHCVSGGWVLGNTIDGTQAEYVRIPVADSSLYKVPESVDPKTMVIDPDHNRLKVARLFGAQHISEPELALKHVQDLTEGKGVDTVIEAVGIPATFAQCQELVAPGGIIA